MNSTGNSDEPELALAIPQSSVIKDEIICLSEETQVAVSSDEDKVVAAVSGVQASFTLNEGTFNQPNFGPQNNTQVLATNDFRNANVTHHHHYYSGTPPSSQESQSNLKDLNQGLAEGDDQSEEDCCKISEDIFMRNKTPLRKGTKIYSGYQKHASGRREVAVKFISPCNDQNVKEVEHLVKLASHPNVVQIIQSRVVRANMRELYIVMELCSAQNLQDYLEDNRKNSRPLNFKKTMSYSRQLVAGMEHIHSNQIIHRDMKPENVLLSLNHEHIKLSDFGISKELKHGKSVTKQTTRGMGTDGYRAPETYNSDEISQSSDIYSLGLTVFSLWANGKHAFGEDVDLLNYNIKNNKNRDLSDVLLSGSVKHLLLKLIESMLQFDPKSRPTIKKVLSDLFFGADSNVPSTGPVRVAKELEPIAEGTSETLKDDLHQPREDNLLDCEVNQELHADTEQQVGRLVDKASAAIISDRDRRTSGNEASPAKTRKGSARRRKKNVKPPVANETLSSRSDLQQDEQVSDVATAVQEMKVADDKLDTKPAENLSSTGGKHPLQSALGRQDIILNKDSVEVAADQKNLLRHSSDVSCQGSTTSQGDMEQSQGGIDGNTAHLSSGARPKRGSRKNRQSKKKTTYPKKEVSKDEATSGTLEGHLFSKKDRTVEGRRSIDEQTESYYRERDASLHHIVQCATEKISNAAELSDDAFMEDEVFMENIPLEPTWTTASPVLLQNPSLSSGKNRSQPKTPANNSEGSIETTSSKKASRVKQISGDQENAEVEARRQKAIASITDLFNHRRSEFHNKLFQLKKKIKGFFSCKLEVMCGGSYLLDCTIDNLQDGHRLCYPDKVEECNSLMKIELNGKSMMVCEFENVSRFESTEILDELKPDIILWYDKKTLELFVMPLCDTNTSIYREFECQPKRHSILPREKVSIFSVKRHLEWIKNHPISEEAKEIRLFIGDWKKECLEIVLVPKIIEYLLGEK